MRKFILGSDWWTDCDDAVALRILARAHKKGQIRLRAVALNACMEDSVRSLDGFLSAEGVYDVPIGLDPAATDFGGHPPYQKRLAAFATRYASNAEAEDAVRLYRRVLAESEEPIEILEIGFLQVIAGVLESAPDDLCELDGVSLFRAKVRKVWVMAGKWDEPRGKENNFARNERARSGAERFCRLCPVPVTFLGFEIGADVISGSHLPEDDVLHLVMCDHSSSHGRYSWDPMLALLALTGDEERAGYSAVRGRAAVDPMTGENTFTPSEDGPHAYVRRREAPEYYARAIDVLIAPDAV